MTTGRPGPEDHGLFDELAAAHALDALERADEAAFVEHLRTCARCQDEVAQWGEIAAELAEATPDASPSPALRARLLAAALDSPPTGTTGPVDADAPDDDPAPLSARDRRRRRHRALATAAAVVAVVGATIGALVAGAGGPVLPPATCSRSAACTEVALTSDASHRPVATVMVQGGRVWLRPSALQPDDASRQTYVLWALAAKHPPTAIGTFDVRAGEQRTLEIGTLPHTSSTIAAYAVSLEPGRRAPVAPSDVVAAGHPA